MELTTSWGAQQVAEEVRTVKRDEARAEGRAGHAPREDVGVQGEQCSCGETDAREARRQMGSRSAQWLRCDAPSPRGLTSAACGSP